MPNDQTNDTKPANIKIDKLSGKKGRPFRYMTDAELVLHRQDARMELNTIKRLRAQTKGEELREQRTRQMWKLVGEVACISRVLRDRWADPEDMNWARFNESQGK